jgi:sugar phosphate isomerase/epimerase
MKTAKEYIERMQSDKEFAAQMSEKAKALLAAGEKDVSFLLEHASRLRHFHIHDGTENPPRNHLALGDGEIDLRARLDLAARRGARCVLEAKTIAALERSVAWLHANAGETFDS